MTLQHTIKAVIRKPAPAKAGGDESGYVAECLEIAVVTLAASQVRSVGRGEIAQARIGWVRLDVPHKSYQTIQ